MNSPSTKVDVPESEAELISTAQKAVSHCNWMVGECAAKWTVKYAKGKTDADFASQVGLSPDQIYQRRRVWETFSDVKNQYPSLKWSHFYVALNWNDAPECLQWAEETESTVQEMKVWRKAVKGEEEQEVAMDAFAGDPSVLFVPTQLTEVKGAEFLADGEQRSVGPGSAEHSGNVATMSQAARETDPSSNYTPYRSDAMSVPKQSDREGASKPKSEPSVAQVLKKIVVTMEKVNSELTSERCAGLGNLSEKLKERLKVAFEDVQSKLETHL